MSIADAIPTFLATPAKASIALRLIETYSVEIGDELSALLTAKDDKGKSKLLALMEKWEECGPLVDYLCASSATIKSAMLSADTFAAMAKPSTAAVALMLLE